ncbi:MAG TPA: hypothetical protein VMN36_02095 [Verrucomicrobiales bacterium]|nr:hypothetical protein [Verrucomicrobiales bacterium]
MRVTCWAALGAGIALSGPACESSKDLQVESGPDYYSSDTADSETEARYWANRARIADTWMLTGGVLDAEMDRSRRRVIRAAAQEGATLASIRPPQHTRVMTTATAKAIYYNAYLKRFELEGPIELYQGRVFNRYPEGQKVYILEDGYVRFPAVRAQWKIEEAGGIEVMEKVEVEEDAG